MSRGAASVSGWQLGSYLDRITNAAVELGDGVVKRQGLSGGHSAGCKPRLQSLIPQQISESVSQVVPSRAGDQAIAAVFDIIDLRPMERALASDNGPAECESVVDGKTNSPR
jgi:hypothetical protein